MRDPYSVGILGAGRQAIEAAGYLQQAGVDIAFFFEDSAPAYDRDLGDYGAPIVQTLAAANDLACSALLSAVGDPDVRRRLVGQWPTKEFTSVVCPEAWLAPNVTVGVGCTVAPLAALNRWARVGDHVLVNVGAIICHDVVIGDFTTLGPGCRIGGGCVVHEGAYVGIGATVSDHVILGPGAFVAAGAVVVDDVPPETLVMGVPARPKGTAP